MFDRNKLVIKSLKQRKNRIDIKRKCVSPNQPPQGLSLKAKKAVGDVVADVRRARAGGAPVVLAFGAHTIKNCMAQVLIELMEKQWVTHLATNGAGIIHDWEFAFQGKSGEDVRANIETGEFGIWEETGFYLNLALVVGAFEGLGYGESIGAMIYSDGLTIPSRSKLAGIVANQLENNPQKAASAADLLAVANRFDLKAGPMSIPHPCKKYSVQAAAFRLGVPFTAHPMFGHDIIYTHPMSYGAAIGRTAERDFLRFADSISNIGGGVYLSVGSAVMSPMIFEKAFAMAQNMAIRQGKRIDDHCLVVVDLAEADWDWQKDGEPPPENSAYYLRYLKTFSRMGGAMKFITADNRDVLLKLCQELR